MRGKKIRRRIEFPVVTVPPQPHHVRMIIGRDGVLVDK